MHAAARAAGLNLREVDGDVIGISVDETTTTATVEAVLAAFDAPGDARSLDHGAAEAIPDAHARHGEILTHPVFRRYHTEHEMLRYLRRARRSRSGPRPHDDSPRLVHDEAQRHHRDAGRDLARVRRDPSVRPLDQVAGYTELIADLERMLLACTGYDAVSLQPNAGSQGEFAGLLAIRAYHRSRGDDHRTVCLIPSSAHGTNAASAVLAGMEVVVVGCDDSGNVDVDDLRAKAAEQAAVSPR